MKVMRSVFYIPANREDFIKKAPEMPADVIVFDLEDSVPPAEKAKGRELTRKNLKHAGSGGAQVYVRVNCWDTGMTNIDIEAAFGEGLDAIVLPKCAGPDHVQRLEWKLEEMEQRFNMEPGSIEIQLLIETAKGMMNVYESACASPRVNSLVFGVVDYTTDMRVPLNQPLGEEQKWARARLACAARAADILAIDSPYVAVKDVEGFTIDTLYGKNLGFEGRMLVHPDQIEASHKIYTPDPERVQWAKEVVKVFEEEGITKGSAAIMYKGKMIDTPVYTSAQNVLAVMAEIESRKK
ncbi:HpcH/HpaI aldolase/citrate lyase family protein [Chloroflexota bacterium]